MTCRKVPILITSAGRRVELVNCFRNAASALELDLEVITCDLRPEISAACQVADRTYRVPRCDAHEYVERLLEIVARHDVKLIVPTIDPELEPLADNRARFESVGARVHVSSSSTVRIARDKLETMRRLQSGGIRVPFTIPFDEAIKKPDTLPWPLLMKPVAGSASRGLLKVCSPKDLPPIVDEPMILQAMLTGREYTVNIFVDQDGVLRTVVPHERLSIRAGEVEKGRTVRDPALRQLADNIFRLLPETRGVICFQAIRDHESCYNVFEINGRFGGGYPLADHAGAKFAQWLLEEVVGRPSTADDNWRHDVLMLRYDAAVYRG